jgi:hypothetical protein
MHTVDTRYGPIATAGVVERFADGTVKSCSPAAECPLATPYGALTPQFTTDDLRRRTVQSLSFHQNGVVRHLPLERGAPVRTPAGDLTAELLTFHPDGSLHRIFPLNGKLSGMWSETDEGQLARPATLRTPLGPLTARFIGASFAPGGELLSLTLWPGETLRVATPVGGIEARIGLSFRPDGSLRSLEPARPQPVPTTAGMVQAYDLDAVGVCGDVNSLAFGPDGCVERVSSSLTGIVAERDDGPELVIEPFIRESLCGDGEHEVTPLRLKFGKETVCVQLKPEAEWLNLPLSRWRVRTRPFWAQFARPLARVCAG